MAVAVKRLCKGVFNLNSLNTGFIASGNLLKASVPRTMAYLGSVRRLSDNVEDKESTQSKNEGEKIEESADPFAAFPDDVNPVTKERGGPKGPEPTRYGDWERKGRCIDF
ncbi:succinate dehydrogenase assembly factor 4, mitochondrial-like [Actinia tenebrosa]|uniref:Succinate dehydrogenase assembly factor 4, mitochondrial n=1 Tax=Actinia tenebrosa TaxID=6105 RepID=A0A6P8J1M6_ACTTE|nr:succinate dehydrogenase assembly factor 4, mitochondrial-like [Actinia tenebrosa]